MNTNQKEFLTVKDICNKLGVTELTVYSWLTSGKLKGFRAGGYLWRIKQEDFDQFIQTAQQEETQAKES